MADDWKLELFSPFLREREVDERLLRVLGIAADTRYEGSFGKVPDSQAIYYLEYLVERILDAVAGDEALRRHFMEYRRKYIFK